jgi:hypothetical protein
MTGSAQAVAVRRSFPSFSAFTAYVWPSALSNTPLRTVFWCRRFCPGCVRCRGVGVDTPLERARVLCVTGDGLPSRSKGCALVLAADPLLRGTVECRRPSPCAVCLANLLHQWTPAGSWADGENRSAPPVPS